MIDSRIIEGREVVADSTEWVMVKPEDLKTAPMPRHRERFSGGKVDALIVGGDGGGVKTSEVPKRSKTPDAPEPLTQLFDPIRPEKRPEMGKTKKILGQPKNMQLL